MTKVEPGRFICRCAHRAEQHKMVWRSGEPAPCSECGCRDYAFANNGEPTYPATSAASPGPKHEGGTVFTVCDECWPKPSEQNQSTTGVGPGSAWQLEAEGTGRKLLSRQKIQPATDEEIESRFFEVEGMDCEHVTLEMSQRFFRRVKARIDADRERIAALEYLLNDIKHLYGEAAILEKGFDRKRYAAVAPIVAWWRAQGGGK